MSSNFFHKPELALRRATELKGINQKDAALELLHDVLSSRRNRTTWSPVFEQIMLVYLDLCLETHRSREAKDGLHQYRNLSQSQAPGSLEKVIFYLMNNAEKACSDAKASVDAEQLANTVVDEEAEADGLAAQSILLSTMSVDPAKSQRDSTLLLPALKFLWETYRAVLDILRSNSKLELVYHAAAQEALKFCRVYHRRSEFRHLCEMLRQHLGNLRQFGTINSSTTEAVEGTETRGNNKVRGWEGWTAESIELNLETRFAQLETASVLHRYTEGFRTVEDIYNILQINMARRKVDPSATVPKAQLMATYYEKLTTLFWVSENHLFHGFAWYKYYTLCKEFNSNNNSRSEEEKRMQASAVLLAALCIPPTPSNSGKMMDTKGIRSTVEDDMVKQKMGKMATLLGFHTKNPTREALLGEIRSKRILDEVPQYMRDLYAILEENSDPLTMVDQAKPLLETLKKEVGGSTSISTDHMADMANDTSLGRYVAPLTHVLLLKLVCNLSAAYHTVSIEHLKKLTAGLDMPFEQVEKSIVQFTQTKMIVLSIDHRSGCLRFGNAELESETMRSQLTLLSKQLQSVVNVLKPLDTSKIAAERKAQYAAFRLALPTEHETLVKRRTFIEKKKEEAERLAQEKAKEELEKKALEDAARKVEEENRIRREQKQREQEKHRKIQEELDTKEKMRILVTMGKNTDEITQEEMAKLDTEALQKEHEAKINKDKEEAERKTQEAAKKLDYLVRAIRIEELPLIKAQYEEKVKNDRERYEHDTVEKLKNAKQQWESDVTDKETLAKHNVFAYFGQFRELVMAGRKKEHKVLCQAEDARAEKIAEEAKFERARKRRDDELKRIAAEEARKKEEEERAKAEEEARQKEAIRKEREAKEEEKRVAEQKRMDEERKKKEGATTGKYVPPSMRGRGAAAGSGGAVTPGNDKDRGGVDRNRGAYPGGGRYEGRTGGSGGSGALGGGGGGGLDRRAGGFGDRRGDAGDSRFGGDRRGDGASRFGGDRRDGDRPGDRGGGGDRYGDRGGSDRPGDRGGGGDRSVDRDSGDRGGGSNIGSTWRRSTENKK